MPATATSNAEPVKRREFRFRFGLRTASIIFLITCTLFGWLGHRYSLVQSKRRALADLRIVADGETYFSYEVSTLEERTSYSAYQDPISGHWLYGDDFFMRIDRMSFHVSASNPPIDLRPFSDLQELNLQAAESRRVSNSNSDQMSASLASVPNLSNIQVPKSIRRFRLINFDVKGLEQFLKQSRSVNGLFLSRVRLGTGHVTNLKFLPHATSLKSLRVDNCPDLRNLEGLTNLKQIQTLSLSGAPDSLEPLLELKKLRELDLSNCKLSNVASFQELPGLRKLRLSFLEIPKTETPDADPQLEFLRQQKTIEDLTVYVDDHVTDLKFIEHLPNLKSLWIYGCSEIENLDELSNTTRLEKLWLKPCSKLKNLDAIEACQSLRILNFDDCQALTSIEPLLQMPNLTSVRLAGCDMIPTSQIDQLKKTIENVEATGK